MDGVDRADGDLLRRHCPLLVGMTVWQIVAPSPERRGFLPIPTTPGDRLFVGLPASAYMHLAWIGLVGSACGSRRSRP